MSLFSRSKKGKSYDLWKLIDVRTFADAGAAEKREQVICDIDKTYLETQFESLVKMARIVFEHAEDKITVRGAAEVLTHLRWGPLAVPLEADERQVYPRPLHFVSSSPPQLRAVLEEKLASDGLDWSSDTFKNQAYNLRKGRFDMLKQQVAYKTAAILKVLGQSHRQSTTLMIGDAAESDAYIYLGIKLFSEGKLSRDGYRSYLQLAHVEPKFADELAALCDPKQRRVSSILIRNMPMYKLPLVAPLTDPITVFITYYEVALHFFCTGRLDARSLWPLTLAFHNRHGYPLSRLQDLVLQARRAATGATVVSDLDTLCGQIGLQSGKIRDGSEGVELSLAAYERLSESDVLRLAGVWYKKLAERH